MCELENGIEIHEATLRLIADTLKLQSQVLHLLTTRTTILETEKAELATRVKKLEEEKADKQEVFRISFKKDAEEFAGEDDFTNSH